MSKRLGGIIVGCKDLINTFSVLSLQLKKLRRHNESVIDLSNANLASGQKEVPRSKGHIMVTTRYELLYSFYCCIWSAASLSYSVLQAITTEKTP